MHLQSWLVCVLLVVLLFLKTKKEINMLSKIRKGIKNFMEEKIQKCEEVLSNAQNRMIIGLVMIGTGVGFITSAYIKTPN